MDKIKIIQNVILFIFLLLPIIPCTLAEPQLDVDIKLNTYEIEDNYVVGDAFYYTINLTNSGSEQISDELTVSVFAPSRTIIGEIHKYNINLIPNQSTIIAAKGGKENETGIYPFDISGDYKIEINSTQFINFYRWILLPKEKLVYKRYIRQVKSYQYSFDVMPRWQYNLFKSTEEANQKIIDANEKLLGLTDDINRATWWLLAIAVFTAIIAYKTYRIGRNEHG